MRTDVFRELGELRVDMSELADLGPCPVDNLPGRKSIVPYEYMVGPDNDGLGITVTKMLPGFECTAPKDACGAIWQDTAIRGRFLERAAIGLARLGYPGLANHLAQEQQPLIITSSQVPVRIANTP